MTTSDTVVSAEIESRDDQVITLRECGCTYVAIAAQLELGRATMARKAYLRGLKRRSPEERSILQSHELARFDALATSISARRDLSEDEISRRLATVDLLRQELLNG